MDYTLDTYRGPYPELPPTATYAFRFHRRNDVLLYSQGEAYEADLVDPAQWPRVAAGLRVFVRLPGGLETAPIVHALVLENQLNAPAPVDTLDDGRHRVLRLDLHPDRPAGQQPAPGEVVTWHRSQFRSLFVYWPRVAAGRRGPQRDA